ncbi:GntR family transcriptional regulator [Scopulibacillus cellulosilyticus]|uniref:GntR family transcriptional regulator n=1 Tax=Scopulibacillus cellulosilyticus TaxID=2665665 RepID=A0ABW2PQY6_9BACL
MPIPENIKKPIRQSAKTIALNQLQKWITEGVLQSGEKISDADLSQALGVSRTPVREALQILEMQGFVEMQPGKETRITAIDREDIPNIYQTLAALDETAVNAAIEKVTEEDIISLIDINKNFAYAITEKDSLNASKLDEKFHKKIIEISGNHYIDSFTDTLYMHAARVRFVYFKSYVPASISVKEHEKIIEALKAKDKQAAAKIIRENWLRPMEEIIKNLNGKEESSPKN